MNWHNVLNWALNAAVTQAQKAAVIEIQKAAQSLNKAVEVHAPDMQHLVQEQLTKAATTAVAGILSRKG